MVYLYAGLGVAMLSGIMAIFEMGLAVTGQSLLKFESRYHASNYFKSKDRTNDIKLKQDLSSGMWRKAFKASNPPGTLPGCGDLYAPGSMSWRNVSSNQCESYSDNGRRIVVDINSDEVIYICLPKTRKSQCSFEEES